MPIRTQYDVKPVLINQRATQQAKKIMEYLSNIYGNKTLTGQQIGVVAQPELEVIKAVTGKYPAVYGFDMMDYSPSRVERGASCQDVEEAIKWWNDGGIVTFCWHWNAPVGLIDESPERSWDRGFYTEATTFSISKAMADQDGQLFKLLVRDIDAIAEQLKRLQTADVPVLWRPLHEASGGWFWWGAEGPEPCIKLWQYMYRRLTDYHGLNHLIWVWNGQHRDWYPGDQYVDIIGEDIYAPKRDYSSQLERFEQALSYTSTPKLIALTENGVVPSLEAMENDQAMWLWQCTWYGDFVCKRAGKPVNELKESNAAEEEHSHTSKQHHGEQEKYVYCEDYTERQALIDFYNDERSVTRDQLPNFRI